MMPFEKKIAEFIERESLFNREDKLLVALSGGADSVALLLALKGLGYDLEAVHCNFHIRGDEAERDALFCEELCRHINVPFHRKDFDTNIYAKTRKVSVEMAARELRYSFFEELRKEIGAVVICVAHHCEDQAETVLMNLLRGTGIKGLRGMIPLHGFVARPLLNVSRKEIENYLDLLKQPYVTDSTNLETDYSRNKLRLQVLPLLQEINPGVVDNIVRTANNLRQAELMLHHEISDFVSSDSLSIEDLKQHPSPEYVLFELLQNKAFSSAQINQISESLDGENGRRWLSPTHELLIDRGRILIQKRTEDHIDIAIEITQIGTFQYAEGQEIILFEQTKNEAFLPSTDNSSVDMDLEKVRFPLILRKVKTGDRIRLSKGGTKLVSDLLCDNKKSLFEKRSQLVLVDASDAVLWVVGLRLSAHVYVTQETRSILSARLRSSGVSMPTVSTSVNPTRIL